MKLERPEKILIDDSLYVEVKKSVDTGKIFKGDHTLVTKYESRNIPFKFDWTNPLTYSIWNMIL